MKRNQSLVLAFAAIAILVMATATGLIVSVDPVQAAGDPIVVIVNGSNPVNNLSMGELRKLFLSDRSHWDTGRPVSPVILTAGAPERTQFLKVVYNMNDADFDRYFLQAAFAGKFPMPPKEVGNAGDVRRIVGNSPGAIGFVRSSDFHGYSELVVKMVRIDGAAATDAAYKIHM
jgi:ABC-type phosphate transport system substrate-binding protein